MDTKQFIDLENEYGAHNYHPLDVVISSAEGVWVTDVDGKKYLDCLSAYSAVNQGHVHPKILKAMVDQASKVTLTSRAFRNDQLGLFYKQLSEMSGYEMSLPMNSGAEAVETAVKLARKWGYIVKNIPQEKANIIVVDGNFHGRTVTIISFSTESSYRANFGPYTPGFKAVRYNDARAIEEAIDEYTAAVMVEPIQGEAGVVIPEDGYLTKVRQICNDNNVLMIADEIQTGLGRTGKFFACQHENVKPDITIIGKALSGGFYPISAVLADKDVLGLFKPGEHGSTFGGNPLAAAIGRAALSVIEDEKLAQRSAELGAYFLENLQEINAPVVKEIRGKGLFIAIELKKTAGGARKYCERLMEEGILAKETHDDVIRFAPPLVIDKETIDWALVRIRKVLQSV
ncbi:MAG TPA: ornithine--oxo-acid transaminase [Anaerolineales bacterium]|nr:ornithine--oxo-acid transaminase [Anaerolineales bacterium]